MTGERNESAALWPGEPGPALPIGSDPQPRGSAQRPLCPSRERLHLPHAAPVVSHQTPGAAGQGPGLFLVEFPLLENGANHSRARSLSLFLSRSRSLSLSLSHTHTHARTHARTRTRRLLAAVTEITWGTCLAGGRCWSTGRPSARPRADTWRVSGALGKQRISTARRLLGLCPQASCVHLSPATWLGNTGRTTPACQETNIYSGLGT